MKFAQTKQATSLVFISQKKKNVRDDNFKIKQNIYGHRFLKVVKDYSQYGLSET